MHDWTRVDSGLFHAFHQRWIGSMCDALNGGVLPTDYFALAEQNIRGPIPDVLALKLSSDDSEPESGGLAVTVAPPRTAVVRRSEADIYSRRADRISVRHRHGDVVAVVEIVSPGNKASRAEFRAFVERSVELVQQKVHLLVVDLFPPSATAPYGIWKAFVECGLEACSLRKHKPLVVASLKSGPRPTVFFEEFCTGDPLPEMPLLLRPEVCVDVPLEATYMATWAVFPTAVKGSLE
jgi:hypothetical protein